MYISYSRFDIYPSSISLCISKRDYHEWTIDVFVDVLFYGDIRTDDDYCFLVIKICIIDISMCVLDDSIWCSSIVSTSARHEGYIFANSVKKISASLGICSYSSIL